MTAHADFQIIDPNDLRIERSVIPFSGAGKPAEVEAETDSELEALVVKTINALAATGVSAAHMGPLFELWNAVQTRRGDAPTAQPVERRDGTQPASDVILARASVIIDLLIHAGHTPDKAAQLMARQIVASGLKLPEIGGDPRGWKRLRKWRTNLIQGRQPQEAIDAYLGFKQEILDIPLQERVARAIDHRLWDRHRSHDPSARLIGS